MSWHFSRVLGEAFSADTCSGGEPFAPSNSTPMHGTYWSPGKMTDALPRSRFGMTYAPLTDARGEELLTWFRAGFPVKTSPSRGEEPESPGNDPACGERWRGSLARYCPLTSSWKTHQLLLDGDWEPFSETWPRWGIMSRGECWGLATPEHLTSDIESGSWATPTTMDKLPPKSEEALLREAAGPRKGRSRPANLRDQMSNAHLWPTPTATDAKSRSYYGPKDCPSNLSLVGAVKKWPTPKANDGERHGSVPRPHWKRKPTSNYLRDEVQRFPTPLANDAKNNCSPSAQNRNTKALNVVAGGALNPEWVEWLMGWPIGWTDLKPLAMVKFQQWCDSHGRGSDDQS
jgi:hypothetical protein